MESEIGSLSEEKEILSDDISKLRESNSELEKNNSVLDSMIDEKTKENDRLLIEVKELKDSQVKISEESKDFYEDTRSLGEFESTAYAVGDSLTPSDVTADGTDVSNTIYSPEGYRIVAVDPSVISMGSILNITIDGYGSFIAKASDTGGAIKGNKIDLLVGSPEEAMNFGRRYHVDVEVLSEK